MIRLWPVPAFRLRLGRDTGGQLAFLAASLLGHVFLDVEPGRIRHQLIVRMLGERVFLIDDGVCAVDEYDALRLGQLCHLCGIDEARPTVWPLFDQLPCPPWLCE